MIIREAATIIGLLVIGIIWVSSEFFITGNDDQVACECDCKLQKFTCDVNTGEASVEKTNPISPASEDPTQNESIE